MSVSSNSSFEIISDNKAIFENPETKNPEVLEKETEFNEDFNDSDSDYEDAPSSTPLIKNAKSSVSNRKHAESEKEICGCILLFTLFLIAIFFAGFMVETVLSINNDVINGTLTNGTDFPGNDTNIVLNTIKSTVNKTSETRKNENFPSSPQTQEFLKSWNLNPAQLLNLKNSTGNEKLSLMQIISYSRNNNS